MSDATFTPALGRPGWTAAYDRAIAIFTREPTWRSALLAQVAPRAGEAILDVGCGTGSFTILIKQAAPQVRVVGLDPDADILAIAAKNAAAAGVDIEWRQGFARDAARGAGIFDKAVSSLVFHQVLMSEKQAGVAAMLVAARPGGEVHIADYGCQGSWLMRRLFRIVQHLDGFENTQPNADGALEAIIARVDCTAARPIRVIRTPTGAIRLFRVHAPHTDNAKHSQKVLILQ